MKSPKVTKQEARDLKNMGFIPQSINKLIQRHLIKKMIPLGARVSMKRSDNSLFVGYSIPLNQKNLDLSEIEKLEDVIDELKDIIKKSKF